MPRGRRRKFKFRINIRPDTARSLVAMTLIIASVVGLISAFAPGYEINAKIQEILNRAFGRASILVPFLLFLMGLLFVDVLKSKFKEPRIFLGGLLLLFTLSALLHLFMAGDGSGYKMAKAGQGGGIVGYKIMSVLTQSISIYGAAALVFLLFFVALIIIFDISLDQIVRFLQSQLSKINFKLPAFGLPGARNEYSDEQTVSSGVAPYEEDTDGEPEYTTSIPVHGDIQPEVEIIPPPSEPEEFGLGIGSTVSIAPSAPAKPDFKFTDKIWKNPPLELLAEPLPENLDTSDTEVRAKIIRETLKSFGIDVDIEDIRVGSSVTQFSLRPRSVTKVSKIASLQENLALALASPTGSVRIEAPIPGKSLIGIEVPNNIRSLVSFKPLLTSEPMKAARSKLTIVLGKDVGGRTYTYDVGKMPHLLIAGATNSGKSVFIHNILFSILYKASPSEVKFILMDPKRVELMAYNDIPHLITPVVTDTERAPSAFKWAVSEMMRRYKLFEQAKARNIEAYNEKSGFQALPYIVIVVDELAEIMVQDPAGVEKSIIRLAQLARATGIHLILAVQRPSTEIITGLIKANIPCRVAFNVASQIDSRVIIDQPGAEKLLGKGDMLFVPPDVQKPIRLQGAYISDKEIASLVNYLRSQEVAPEYRDEILAVSSEDRNGRSASTWGDVDDELFGEAVDLVTAIGKASASLLQRKLSIGYARAARLIDIMEDKGLVGPAVGGSKARDVLRQRPKMETADLGIVPEDDFNPEKGFDIEEPLETFS